VFCKELCAAEISENTMAFGIDKDVFGLYVVVDDAYCMQ
jgi:hypothetical protein